MVTVSRLSRALGLCASLFAMPGCGAALPTAAARAQVRFELTPDTARVYTEDRFVGTGRVLSGRSADFRTGPRQLTITADGYFPHDLEVDLPEGTTTIRVSLRPVPP